MDILLGKLYKNISCYTSEMIYADDEFDYWQDSIDSVFQKETVMVIEKSTKNGKVKVLTPRGMVGWCLICSDFWVQVNEIGS